MMENNNYPIYQEYEPTDVLKEIVFNYWKFSVPLGEEPLYHVIPPDGCISLTFTINQYLPSTLVEFSGAGFEMKEVEIPPSTTFIGIRFQPGTFNLIFPHSIEELKFKFVDASHDEELKSLAEEITPEFDNFKTFDQLLLPRIKGHKDTRIAEAVQMIIEQKGDISLNEMHKLVPLNERHFQRIFKRLVGVSAKEFTRLIRIRHALIDLVHNNNKLTDVAYDHGYYDQSHFNRDLLKLSQKSPSQLKKYYQSIETQSLNW